MFLALICQSARAEDHALEMRAVHAGYGHAADIEIVICDAVHEFDQSKGPCNEMTERMKSGHLVNETRYNGWCGEAKAYRAEAQKRAADYKKVYGKTFEFGRCRK